MTQIKDILLVGSYPPPYGGCSVHIQRLKKCLVDTFNINILDFYSDPLPRDALDNVYRCGVKQPKSLAKAIYYLIKHRVDLVHFHVSAMNNFLFAGYLFLAALKNDARKVISIHSGSFIKNFENSGRIKRLLLRSLLRKFDQIITVNKEQKCFIESLGISNSMVTVAAAFLPPIICPSERVVSVLENTLKNNHRIITLSGYALPYYGFHLLLNALDSDSKLKNSFSVIFCFYNTYDNDYVKSLTKRLDNCYDYAIFKDLDPEEFAFVISKSDIYVRATDRDGDAVAIREAAFCGKKIIASDCVGRPSGAILFNIDDTSSLVDALNKSVEEVNSGIVTFDYNENLRTIDRVYKNLLNVGVDDETDITES